MDIQWLFTFQKIRLKEPSVNCHQAQKIHLLRPGRNSLSRSLSAWASCQRLSFGKIHHQHPSTSCPLAHLGSSGWMMQDTLTTQELIPSPPGPSTSEMTSAGRRPTHRLETDLMSGSLLKESSRCMSFLPLTNYYCATMCSATQ